MRSSSFISFILDLNWMYSNNASGTAQFAALSTKSQTGSPAVILATAVMKAQTVAYTNTYF